MLAKDAEAVAHKDSKLLKRHEISVDLGALAAVALLEGVLLEPPLPVALRRIVALLLAKRHSVAVVKTASHLFSLSLFPAVENGEIG
jgi:hypothetical protein